MTKTIFIIFLNIATLLTPQIAAAKKDIFDSEFNRFIRLEGKWASGAIDCSKTTGDDTFFYVRKIKSSSNTSTDKKEGSNENKTSNVRYIYNYMKNEKHIYSETSVSWHEVDNSRAYLETSDSKFRMNIQLTNPKMVPIRSGDLPKGSKYTRTPVTEGEGFIVTAPDAVYIWENNNENAKLLCDITTETD
jgi:hypothetical protein